MGLLVTTPSAAFELEPTKYSAIFWDGSSFKTWEQVVPKNKIKTLEKKLKKNKSVIASGVPSYRKALGEADPSIGKQWGLEKLDFKETSNLSVGEGVVVAVVDTGVDGNHPDLQHSLISGYDVYDEKTKGLFDPNGHGTHVAGIIAAAYNNGIAGSGIAPGVKIMPIRVLDKTGYGEDSDVAKGILWAVANGAHIINLSLGGPDRDPLLEDAVNFAKSNGVAVVAAAGNDGMSGSKTSYPAAHASTIAVAATTSMDTHAPFSTKAKYVDIAAPGMGILSTWVNKGESTQSGTSMATPFVAGSIALIMDYKKVNALTAGSIVLKTATDIGPAGIDELTGAGLVDPLAALTTGAPRKIEERRKSLTPPDWSLIPINLPDLPKPTLPPLPNYPGGGWVPPGFPTGEPYYPINPPNKFPVEELPPFPAPVNPPVGAPPGLSPVPNDTEFLKLQPVLKTQKSKINGETRITASLIVNNIPLYGKQIEVSINGKTQKSLTDSLGRVSFKLKNKPGRIVFKGDSFYRPITKVVKP